MRLRLTAALVAGSVMVLSACGGDGDQTTATSESGPGGSPTTEPSAPVSGTTWALDELTSSAGTVSAPADAEVYLLIDATGTVLGNTGCNGFSGTADVADGTIVIAPLISTKVACPGDVGTIDTAMLQILDGEVTAEVSGDVLTITHAEAGSLTMHVTADATPSS